MLVVVMALCTLSASPGAPDTAGTPEARLAEAQAAFDKLELEDAAHKLEALVADPAASPSVRARAWLALGLARASMLDDAGASVAFAAALAIDGSLAPPPDSSPKVKALFEKTRARLPAGASLETRAPPPPPKPAPPKPAPPKAPAPASDDGLLLGMGVTGAALLVGAAGAAVGALVADDALGHPVAGRTRDEYQTIKGLGVAGVVGAGVLAVAGVVTLGVGLAPVVTGATP